MTQDPAMVAAAALTPDDPALPSPPSPRSRQMVTHVGAQIHTQYTEEFERLRESITSLTVCTSLPDQEAEERANLVPPGKVLRWRISQDPELATVACDEKATHRHLVMEC